MARLFAVLAVVACAALAVDARALLATTCPPPSFDTIANFNIEAFVGTYYVQQQV